MPNIFDEVANENIFDKVKREATISTRTEEPGFFANLFRPGAMTPKDTAKAQNIVAISKATAPAPPVKVPFEAAFGKMPPVPSAEEIVDTTGLPLSYVKENYDAITRELGIRGVPTTGEMVEEGMKYMIGGGLAKAPIHTILGLGGYMGAKEGENVLAAKLRGKPYEFGGGQELSQLAGEVNKPTEAALALAEFFVPAAAAGMAGKGLAKGAGRAIFGKPEGSVLSPIPEIPTKAQIPYPPGRTGEIPLMGERAAPPLMTGDPLPPEPPGLMGERAASQIMTGTPEPVTGLPKRPYMPPPRIIGESTVTADRVAEALSKPAFLRNAEDLAVLRNTGTKLIQEADAGMPPPGKLIPPNEPRVIKQPIPLPEEVPPSPAAPTQAGTPPATPPPPLAEAPKVEPPIPLKATEPPKSDLEKMTQEKMFMPKPAQQNIFDNPAVSEKMSSALEKDPSKRTLDEKLTIGSALVRKLKDETGAIFIPGRGGRITPPPTTLPPIPDNVKLMYEITDDVLRDMNRIDAKRVRDFLVRGIVDASGNVKRELVKGGGWMGQRVVEQKDLIAGAPSRAAMIIDEAQKSIYGDLSKKKIHLLDKIINSRRTAQIDRYKLDDQGQPIVKHPMGLNGSVHEQYLADLARIEKITPQEVQALNAKADAYFKTMREQLDELLKEGLITPETHQALYRLEYSPREFIQHIDPDGISIRAGGKLVTVGDSGIKKLEEGSENLLNYDSRHLISQVVARTQARIARNKANVALYDLLLSNPANGVVKEVPKTGAPTGYGLIKAMVDGKPVEMMMPLERVQEWVVRDPLIDHTLAQTLGWVSGSKVLRAMATGYNPAFAISNMPRDLALVWMANKEYSPHLPVAFAEQLKDIGTVLGDAIRRKGRYKDYVNEGGGMELLSHYGRFTGMGEVNKISTVLGYVGETSEIITRLALRERAIKNGKTPEEATWIARSYLDFSQGGSMTKAVDTVIPYFNASVQGTRSLARAAKNDPAIFAYKSAQLMTLASSLYFANRMMNDEGYRQVSDRDKEANFIVMLPPSFAYTDDKGDKKHMYLKIAKDQGQRIMTTIPEAIMDRYFEGKIPKDQMYQAVGDFVSITPTNLIAPLQTSIFSYVMNKNFWTNQDLWKGPSGIEASEEYRAGDYPDFYLKMTKAAGISPTRTAGAVGRILPYSNPFIGLVGGGFDLATGKMSEDMKGKAAKQIMLENPSVRRLISSTSAFNEGKAEREEIKKEGVTENWVQNRTVDDLTTKYLKNKDRETYDKLTAFLKTQKEEDQDRLLKRIETNKIFQGIPDHSWWVGLRNTNDPETRAKLFIEKFSRSSYDKRKEMIRIADEATGIISDRFLDEIEKIRMPKKPTGLSGLFAQGRP